MNKKNKRNSDRSFSPINSNIGLPSNFENGEISLSMSGIYSNVDELMNLLEKRKSKPLNEETEESCENKGNFN